MAGGTILPRRTGTFEPPAVFVQGGRVKEVILTSEGFEKLKDEIQFLSNDRRREVAERIRVAREFGDIAENAEYDTAKNEQAHLEARIALLEERLKSSRVVTKKEIKSGEVSIGTKVRLRDVGANKTVETVEVAAPRGKLKFKIMDIKAA